MAIMAMMMEATMEETRMEATMEETRMEATMEATVAMEGRKVTLMAMDLMATRALSMPFGDPGDQA
jgi:hypothetical protein